MVAKSSNSNRNHTPNSKIQKAIKKLKTLDLIKVIKIRTSHYKYGVDESSIQDRLDISIRLNDDQNVSCQIVLDSTDHTFPPDIIFRKSSISLVREPEDLTELLPKDWDLNDENCLYNWFTYILSKKEQWFIYKAKEDQQKHDMWDLFDEDFTTATSDEDRKSTKKKIGLLGDMIAESSSSHNQDNETSMKERMDSLPKSAKPFPIFNKGKRKYDPSEDEHNDFEPEVPKKQAKLEEPEINKVQEHAIFDKDMREFRRGFILFWINKYRDHIVQYDSVNFGNLVLYMNFEITKDDLLRWDQYSKIKSKNLEEFIAKTTTTTKISRQQRQALMVVNFDMDDTNKLRIKLVSVINTAELNSSLPDSIDVEYELDFSKDMPDLARSVNQYIHQVGIKFHLLQSP